MAEIIKLTKKEHTEFCKKPQYNEMYKKLVDSWKHQKHTDEELKEYAKDMYNNKIFSDRHLGQNYHLFTQVFMAFVFIKNDIEWDMDSREGKIIHMMLNELEDEYIKRRDVYFEDVGLVFEYMKKANPMAINGYPTFFSCRILNKKDTDKMFEFYEKYKELQEKVNEEF